MNLKNFMEVVEYGTNIDLHVISKDGIEQQIIFNASPLSVPAVPFMHYEVQRASVKNGSTMLLAVDER